LTHSVWAPNKLDSAGHPIVGAAPMIIGSFSVTLIAALIGTPLPLLQQFL
jgi:hypothetical protein